MPTPGSFLEEKLQEVKPPHVGTLARGVPRWLYSLLGSWWLRGIQGPFGGSPSGHRGVPPRQALFASVTRYLGPLLSQVFGTRGEQTVSLSIHGVSG